MATREEMKRVLVVAETDEHAAVLAVSVEEAGCRVSARRRIDEDWQAVVATSDPDLLVIHTESAPRELIDPIVRINTTRARPAVIFTEDGDRDAMAAALRAGVTAYVVQGLEPGRVSAVLDLAIARFEEIQALRKELEDARSDLAARKITERAKGIIMRQRRSTEDEAYRTLQKMAMDQKKRIADVAHDVILIAQALTPEG